MRDGQSRYRAVAGAAALLAGLLLAGCGGDADLSDLREFRAQAESRGGGRIEPLPEFVPYQPFAYSASGMRSPFEPPVVVRRIQPGGAGSNVKPDFERPKEFLEQFPIGSLTMVGTLARDGSMFALVQDGQGGVHRVQSGDYMGTNHGRVLAVTDNDIQLREIVADGTGGWLERNRTVVLGGGSEG